MGFNYILRLFAVFVVAFSGLSLCQAYEFYVGGKDGWVEKPSEEYNHWAERNRFQVDDTLLFKHIKSDDSVLLVTRDNYLHCYTKAPIQTLIGGDIEFKLNRSGPFYFISGNEDHCKQGQRVIVVVLADRRRKSPPPSQPQLAPPPESSSSSPSVAPSSTPASPPEAEAPESGEGVGPSPSPSESDISPTPSPSAKANSAGRGVGGDLGLATLCLGVLGAFVLLNN